MMAMDCIFKKTCKAYGLLDCNTSCYPYVALYGSEEKNKFAYRLVGFPVKRKVNSHHRELLRT